MARFSTLEYFIAAKQILQVQGISLLLTKLRRLSSSSYQNRELIQTIQKFSSEYDILIDIGTKVGGVTIESAKYFVRCICFEPFLQNYKDLIKKIKVHNLDNVITYNIALGNKKESKKLFLSPNNPGQNRFNVNPDENWDSIETLVETLDSTLNDLEINGKYLIKIDVEGYELNVLKGAVKTLAQDCIIISEFWPWAMRINNIEPTEYVDFLKSLDYSFFNLDGNPVNKKYFKKLCQQNKRFVTDDFIIKKSH